MGLALLLPGSLSRLKGRATGLLEVRSGGRFRDSTSTAIQLLVLESNEQVPHRKPIASCWLNAALLYRRWRRKGASTDSSFRGFSAATRRHVGPPVSAAAAAAERRTSQPLMAGDSARTAAGLPPISQHRMGGSSVCTAGCARLLGQPIRSLTWLPYLLMETILLATGAMQNPSGGGRRMGDEGSPVRVHLSRLL
jgi:hypothetical protein